jgi:hypothetical protein
MQSIAALCCVAFFAALLPQGWVQACCLAQPKQYRSPWKRIRERSSTISNSKLKPGRRDHLGLRGRRRGPIGLRIAILGIAGVAVGFAGGTVAVANAAGAGGDDPSAGNCGEV